MDGERRRGSLLLHASNVNLTHRKREGGPKTEKQMEGKRRGSERDRGRQKEREKRGVG